MLSTSESMVLSGLLLVNEEFCPIYVHTTTGDCAYEDPDMSTGILISELSVPDPMEITNLSNLRTNLSSMKGKMIGLILKRSGTAIVILDENTAVERPLSSLDKGGTPFPIDMTMDYDDYEDEDDDE